MGVVTVSSSAARSPLGLCTKLSNNRSAPRRLSVVAFKPDESSKTALVVHEEKILSPVEKPKKRQTRGRKASTCVNKTKAVSVDMVSPCTPDVDYNEAAAKLESLYNLSPVPETSDVEDVDCVPRRRKKVIQGDTKADNKTRNKVVRNRVKKVKRLSLDTRIALKKNSIEKIVSSILRKNVVDDNNKNKMDKNEKTERLLRDYSASTDLVSLDWKKMKIPPVLSSTEHTWLFNLMQPMKALLDVKDQLEKSLEREPTEAELAEATNLNVILVKKDLAIGRAARNKLIKHNLRLVLFVINKYFQDFANGPKFQDLCQAGVKGLMIAIDRFEPKRKFQLSTYSLFWIRHAITRSMTTSNFTRVPFGLESVRLEIQKGKLQLLFELGRMPTEEEIITKAGISHERYHDVRKASSSILSLQSRHIVTQEEFINGIMDSDGVGSDNRRQPALLRLALDDVLDSLKPKESLVIRQRYGLDGKGDRTLGEIAGNLNISREMVRKHEVKALLKLKHQTRVDYLRRYIV